MDILITNDDGIHADGLQALVDELSRDYDVTVVAPMYERSGASQSISIHNPVRVEQVHKQGKFYGYAVDGSPVDCVKIALAHIVERTPDLVISGINRGPNYATSTLYSGTVGGALEGAMNGVRSIAVSYAGFHDIDYSLSAEFTHNFIKNIDDSYPCDIVYNINIPAVARDKVKGVKVTRVSSESLLTSYDKRLDPFGKPYYWLSDFRVSSEIDERTDCNAVKMNYISITPLKIDRTDYNELSRIEMLGDKLWQ